MTVFTAPITQIGTESAPLIQLTNEIRYCLRITFGVGQTVYIISHDDAISSLPDGAVYLQSRLSDRQMPNLSRNAGFESGKSTSPTTNYEIADVEDELNTLLSDQNVIGQGSYNRLIEEFEFDRFTKLDLNPKSRTYTPPKHTGIIQDHYRDYNTVTIETSDINRKIDDYIFEPLVWRLRSGISSDATSIPTTLNTNLIDDYQATFESGDWYLENAGKAGGYAQIADEVFFYETFENVDGISTFLNCVRGQCNTSASSHEVPANAEDGTKPEIKSYGVIHESATDLIKQLITGVTADNRILPESWNVGEDIRWIGEESFATYSTPLKLRFEISSKVKCRDFYEKEILALIGAVLVTDGRGRLVLTPRQLPTDVDAGEIVLDDTNLYGDDELVLRHIKKNIHPSIKIGYDWDEQRKKINSSVTYRDTESETHNLIAAGQRLKELTFKGLRSGIHTGTQLAKLSATYGDSYFYEKQEITIPSLINDIPLGTLVTANFRNVRDDANGDEKSLKRTMLVVASDESRSPRKTDYTLSGTLNIQSKRQASQRLHNLEIAEYKRGKINLATLVGITITNGVATGNIVLEMGRSYYYVDDINPGTGLELSSSMNIIISGTGPHPALFVFGPLDIKASIVLSGRSRNVGGSGATENQAAQRGTAGYALSTRSTGGMWTERNYTTFLSSNEEVYSPTDVRVRGDYRGTTNRAIYASAPDPALTLNNGVLGGLPADLSGGSGPGGPITKHDDPDRRPRSAGGSTTRNPTTDYVNGSSGGRGGGGLLIVSWGGAASNIELDGTDGSPESTLKIGSAFINGGCGGGGGPGSLLWIVDGNHAPPLLNGDNVKARYGLTPTVGIPVATGDEFGVGTTARYRQSSTPPIGSTENHWESVTRIAYTPEPESVQESLDSIIAQFFANQRDGRVRIFVQESDPSFASPGDMRITEAELNRNTSDPEFRILSPSGWRYFLRGVDEFEYVYDALIAGKRQYNSTQIISSPTRPVGEPDGTIWFNPTDGTEWILFASGDILIRENQVPQGEDLINDLSFARSAAGDRLWVFTRDRDLPPRNTKNPGTASAVNEPTAAAVAVGDFGVLLDGNRFYFPDNGTYQILLSSDSEEIWRGNGGGFYDVPDGIYDIINLSTGDNVEEVEVPVNTTRSPDAVPFGDFGVAVQGNDIILPDDGYYQIQDYQIEPEIFYQGNGGQRIDIEDGTYFVINLTTNNNTNNVRVPQ